PAAGNVAERSQAPAPEAAGLALGRSWRHERRHGRGRPGRGSGDLPGRLPRGGLAGSRPWRLPLPGERIDVARRTLFAIHLLTASGAGIALLALMAVVDRHWNEAFVWLGIALLVDGVDGPIARR